MLLNLSGSICTYIYLSYISHTIYLLLSSLLYLIYISLLPVGSMTYIQYEYTRWKKDIKPDYFLHLIDLDSWIRTDDRLIF